MLPQAKFNLPPNVSMKHVDPDDDTCPECDGEGSFDESACCGAALLGEDLICGKCFEHCEKAECVACDGKGKVEPTEDPAQDDHEDRIADELSKEWSDR